MSFTKTHKCKWKLYRATSRAEEVARDWPLSECLEEGAVGISEEGEAWKEERPTARKKDVVRVMRREKRGEEEDQSRGGHALPRLCDRSHHKGTQMQTTKARTIILEL
jgi:hypothetical protein